jgi:hypothetical protein
MLFKHIFDKKSLYATSRIFFDYQGKASIIEDEQICSIISKYYVNDDLII